MKKTVLATLALLLSFFVATAQDSKRGLDPSQWTYEVSNLGNGRYDLIFHAKLDKGWHIFSQTPGGDGSLIAPTFEVPAAIIASKENPLLLEEKGKVISQVMEGIDGKVNYYENTVDFVAHIQLKPPETRTIKGTHVYQLCNETTCLAPKSKEFTFEVKP